MILLPRCVLQATWKGMEGVADKGLARAIGISNFSPEKITEWFSDARIYPAVNQVKQLFIDNLIYTSATAVASVVSMLGAEINVMGVLGLSIAWQSHTATLCNRAVLVAGMLRGRASPDPPPPPPFPCFLQLLAQMPTESSSMP